MGDTTKNLSLYKTDMTTDGNDYFDFDRDLNENWDKIDTAIGDLQGNSAKIDLSNLSDEGINKLEAQKMYETGNVLTDEQGYNQLAGMASSTFDSSKLAIVGEPTITEEGIASGFSDRSGVQAPMDLSGDTFEVNIKFKWDEVNTTNLNLFILGSADDLDWQGLSIGYSTDMKILYYLSSDATKWNLCQASRGSTACSTDVWYYLKFIFDGSKYVAYISTDGITYIQDWVLESTTKIYNPQKITIGNAFYTATVDRPFYGEIDLKKYRVKVDGKEVFNCAQTDVDTVEIDGESVVIPYTLSSTGSKIVDAEYRETVQALYEQEGKALYYTLDRDNQNFTLPMGEVYGMIETLQTNIASINSSMDGMWTAKTLTILDTEEFTANYSTKFDLSDYLPNDGNIYEVVVNSYGNTTNTAYSVLGVAVNGGLFTRMVFKAETQTSHNMYGIGSVIIPVTSLRQLTISSTGGVNTNTIRVYLSGYRKVR